MTKSHLWIYVLTLALACLLAPVSAKADMVYNFSFQGSGYDAQGNPISGLVSGRLEFDAVGPATHVWIDTFPAALGKLPKADATRWKEIIKNVATFDSTGALTNFEFEAQNNRGWPAQLNLNFPPVNDKDHPGGTNYLQLDNFVEGPHDFASLHLERAGATQSVVPEPTSILLLGSVLGGVAFVWRKSTKA